MSNVYNLDHGVSVTELRVVDQNIYVASGPSEMLVAGASLELLLRDVVHRQVVAPHPPPLSDGNARARARRRSASKAEDVPRGSRAGGRGWTRE